MLKVYSFSVVYCLHSIIFVQEEDEDESSESESEEEDSDDDESEEEVFDFEILYFISKFYISSWKFSFHLESLRFISMLT